MVLICFLKWECCKGVQVSNPPLGKVHHKEGPVEALMGWDEHNLLFREKRVSSQEGNQKPKGIDNVLQQM